MSTREQLSITMHGMTKARAVDALREAATALEAGKLVPRVTIDESGDAGIDPEDLEGEFTRWSAHYAWRAAVSADADADYEQACLATKRAKAHTFLAEVAKHDRKPADSLLEALAEVNPEVVACGNREVDLLRTKRRLAGELEALRGKRDMVIQLGAKRRAELKLDPIVRD